MKKRWILTAAALLLTGCGRQGYEDFSAPAAEPSTLAPVDTILTQRHYEGVAATKEETLDSVVTGDGACEILRKRSYYDVTLDYTKSSPYEVGAAYAEAIGKIRTDYSQLAEPYLYENIKAAFPELSGDYSPVQKRTERFFSTLRPDYQQELRGFAETVCDDTEGFREDGLLSQEEAMLLQLVPDVLRGTACSAITADGSATASGNRLTARIMEWQLGSDNQLCAAQAVTHIRNSTGTITSVSYLGFLTILTAVNSDGLFMSIFDVGSAKGVKYTAEEKRSYTYDIRYALETYSAAEDAAEYLKNNGRQYPYCVNVLCTDAKVACVAELAVTPREGAPRIRKADSALIDGLVWDDPAYLCVVNSFAAKGNSDQINYYGDNIVRWRRYLALFGGQRGLTLGRLKELMTAEKTDNELTRIRSNGLVHMVLADYETHTLQAVLTGTDGLADEPEFLDLGSWLE